MKRLGREGRREGGVKSERGNGVGREQDVKKGGKNEWRQEGRKNRRGKYVLAVKERGRTKI